MADNEATEIVKLPSTNEVSLAVGQAAIANPEAIYGPSTEQLRLLSASLELASAITERYPQVNESGELNYAIAGSLAAMLLSQAESFEELDASEVPSIAPNRQVTTIPANVSTHLQTLAHHMGDFDYVETEQYKRQKRAAEDVVESMDLPADPMERFALTMPILHKYLRKGGTPLKLSSETRRLLGLDEGSVLASEPVGNFIDQKAVRLSIEGKDYYIVDPRTILAFKAVHLLERLNRSDRPEKYTSDLAILWQGLRQVYPREELLQATHDGIMLYSRSIANGMEIPYHNPGLTPELAELVEGAIALDEDALYLQQLEYGKERFVGILKVLHRYESPEAKQQIIAFINSHRDQIDRWEVDSRSPRTIQLLADFVEADAGNMEAFSGLWGEEEARQIKKQGVAAWLRNSSYGSRGKNSILRAMRDHSRLDHYIAPSDCLTVLMCLDEADLEQQLHSIDALMQRGAATDEAIYNLFYHKRNARPTAMLLDTQIKGRVMNGLLYAADNFDDQTLAAFFEVVYQNVTDDRDEQNNEIDAEGRRELVKAALERFHIPLK